MSISDALYGATEHYVSRARLEAMLDREFTDLLQRLGPPRSDENAFFVFADTVATHGSVRSQAGHGWLGVRFQERPQAEPSEVIAHIEMFDSFTASQQEAVGLIGVNLLHGAFYHHADPELLIRMLMDGIDRRRLEVDMVRFSGPAFREVDNRLMSLQLVEQGMTDTAMFTAGGEVVQPSEILHEQPVLIERGSFRPVTNVTLAMLESAGQQLETGSEPAHPPVVLMEMTLKNLMSAQATIDHADFLARADMLGALGKTVMISSYMRFDSVTSYLRQYTSNKLAMVVGVPTLLEIFKEKYYEDVEGGILGGIGRLFSGPVKLFVYPTVDPQTGALRTADQLDAGAQQFLYAHLLAKGSIEPIRQFDTGQLHMNPAHVLKMIQTGDSAWETLVPVQAAALIKQKGLLGYEPDASREQARKIS
jgi:hypothetical protein